MVIKTDADLASVVMSAIYQPVALFGIVLNAVCLAAMIRGRIVHKNGAFVLMALLCVADINSEVTVCVSGILRLTSLLTEVKFIQLHCYLILFATQGIAGVLPNVTMMFIAFERLYIVLSPFHYQRWSNWFVRSAVGICVIVCVPGIVSAGIGVSDTLVIPACVTSYAMKNGWQDYTSYLGRFLPCGLCCLFYAALIVAFRKHGHRRALAAITEQQHKEVQRKQRNITATAIAVCAAYVLCTALGTLLVSFLGPAVQASSPLAAIVILQTGGLLTAMNAILNAAIFMFRSDEVRKQTKKDFSKLFGMLAQHSSTAETSLNSSSHDQAQSARPISTATSPAPSSGQNAYDTSQQKAADQLTPQDSMYYPQNANDASQTAKPHTACRRALADDVNESSAIATVG